MLNKIVLDLETQKDFSEAGGRGRQRQLRVSVAGIYSYSDDKYSVFEESEIHKLGEILMISDQIIGFNVKQFDLEVLRPYYNFSLDRVPILDILIEIEKVLGHRIGLDVVAEATIGQKKTGTGLAAINLWRAGNLEALKQYCLNDVKLTRQIYEYGRENGKLLYKDFFEVREIPVSFPEAEPRANVVRQGSLF